MGMENGKKKPFIPMLIIGAVLAGFLGYLVCGAWSRGININVFLERFSEVTSHPFQNYYKGISTIRAVILSEVTYITLVLMCYTSKKNYMPGKEYGTARYADVRQVNKFLEEKNGNRNRILSQNVRMSLDTRKTKLNNNILIIGGAGAGKTFYEVKPNLMQMPDNCSFILTDPKGEILRSTGWMLKKNGYQVKVLNLIDMEQSDCYNPFNYLREETDVVKLITNLISNTTPKDSMSQDPFWDKAESMFLQSLFYYVWLEYPKEKQNFHEVMKLIAKAEVKEKNKSSELTIMMNNLLNTSPLGAEHPAYKQYTKVIRGAGDTVRSIIISANARLAQLENKQILRILSKDDMNRPVLCDS